MAAPQPAGVTFDGFLALEEGAAQRNELVGGQIFAMAGGTLRHSMCIMHVGAALLPAVHAQGCRISQGDALLRIGESAYYPDVMVTCVEQSADLYEVAPCLLVEVLSPSTEATDRREKVLAYRAVPTVLTYLLVDHLAEEVTALRRDGTDWTTQVLRAGDLLDLPCPRTTMAVAGLFQNLPS